MNKDQVDGRVKKTKGAIKEALGRVTGNKKMQSKGKVQKAVGKAQLGYGNVKQDIKDAV